MLISVQKLKELYPKYDDIDDELLQMKLAAIEVTIRSHTHNNFQKRAFREACAASGNRLTSASGSHFFKVGDTVQVSVNEFNKGLYVVEAVGSDYVEVNGDLVESMNNLVTKVEYPLDVTSGAINVLEWDCFKREKVGITSETISRHSVSYQAYDGSNTINGYPSALFGFCAPYMRART